MISLNQGPPYDGTPGTWNRSSTPSTVSSRCRYSNHGDHANEQYFFDGQVGQIDMEEGKDSMSEHHFTKNSDHYQNNGQHWNLTSFQELFRFNSAASGFSSSLGRPSTKRTSTTW